MRRLRFAGVVPVLALVLLAACTGGKKNTRVLLTSTATAPAGRQAASPTPVPGGVRPPTQTRSAGGGSVSPAGTSVAGSAAATSTTGACLPESQLGAAASLPAGTPIPRPAIDLNVLTVAPQDVPAGFTAIDEAAGFTAAQRLAASDLARGTGDPQATLDRLNAIGFLGGRQQGWNAVAAQGFVPALYVQHLVFSSDTGASDFLHAPATGPQICLRPESGPSIGQESSHLGYQFAQPLTTGGSGTADGHAVFWRCGRLVINVSGAGGPGQVSQSTIDQFAQKVQGELSKAQQPCA